MARFNRNSTPTNRLLASLPRADLARLMPALEYVDLALGQRLHEHGHGQEHFYFPMTCIVSLLGVLQNGDSAEVSLTGREGGVGLGLVLGGDTTLTRAIVQSAGTALRWKSSALRRAMKPGGGPPRRRPADNPGARTPTGPPPLCDLHCTRGP